MKRILTTITALFLTVAATFAQDEDPSKALAQLDPIFDVTFLKSLKLSPSQVDKLSPKLDEIIKMIQISLKEAEDRISKIDDELERAFQANKAQAELGETIAALADRAADQIFNSNQEILYSAKVLREEFQGKSVAAFVQARIARRMRFTKSQSKSMDQAIAGMRKAFEQVTIDPEAPDAQRQQIMQEHQKIVIRTLQSCANAMDKRQQTIVSAFIDMLSNKNSGAKS